MACTQVFPPKTLIRVYCQSDYRKLSSVSRSYSQVAFFLASIKAMYLASVNERAIVGCLFKHKLIEPLLRMKIKPEVDFQLFLSFVQLKSEYFSTNSLFWPSQMIFRLFEPFKYCKIIFTASVCWQPKFFAKQLATKVAKAILSLVLIIENMKDPIILQQRFFSDDDILSSIFCLRSAVSFIRVLIAQALLR